MTAHGYDWTATYSRQRDGHVIDRTARGDEWCTDIEHAVSLARAHAIELAKEIRGGVDWTVHHKPADDRFLAWSSWSGTAWPDSDSRSPFDAIYHGVITP